MAPTTLRLGLGLGFGCRKCAGTSQITHAQFIERLNRLHPNMISLTEYVNMKTHVTIKCKVCGYIWPAQPLHLVYESYKTGCPKCSGRARRPPEEFVAEVAKLSPTIKIIGLYTRTYKPVLVQCGECSRIWQADPNSLLRGSGCKSCKAKNTKR